MSVVDAAGKKKDLTPVYATAQGLAWTPDGREIWYTAAEGGFNRAVHAVTLAGKTPTRRPRAGDQHDPRHLEGRPGPDDQRERPARHPHPRPRRREGDGSSPGSTTRSSRTSRRTDRRSSSPSRAREGARGTRRTCERWTALRRFVSARAPTEAFSPDGTWAISIAGITGPRRRRSFSCRRASGEPRTLSGGGDGSHQRRLPAGRQADRLHGDPVRAGDAPLRARRRRRQVAGADARGLLDVPRHDHAGREIRRRHRPGSEDLPLSAGGRRAARPPGPRGQASAGPILGGREVPLHPGRPDDSRRGSTATT